jgi:hypothetical protein
MGTRQLVQFPTSARGCSGAGRGDVQNRIGAPIHCRVRVLYGSEQCWDSTQGSDGAGIGGSGTGLAMWTEYEIRFLREAAPTLIFWTACPSESLAIKAMQGLFGLKCDRAEIWRGDRLVAAQDKVVLKFKRAS